MLHIDVGMCQRAFDINWKNWCKGGPSKKGYTRRGLPIACKPVQLVSYERAELPINDVLSKNRFEVERWHVQFLEAKLALGSKFYWKKTAYYWEYIKPRYSDQEGHKRAMEFIDLLADVAENGIRKPVWVADLSCVRNSKVDFFRFDGCHRTACAKVCGIDVVPTLLFTAEWL